ncbi:hypothetical protein HDU83_008598 [Entophlyctis luteolus]|nr:hypothetical protein HDU82_001622 [Entophlyctis luteolus]KAJ3357091.1 hypothetical protein HDU83_008598 [Entophlyctis luteolus]KAJ3392036.1 hypothetical protein HDU84_004964 [Entophlyctis sp. JEL0112]
MTEIANESDERLAKLGYKQEFRREMGLLANVGMSLTAIGVLTGMSSAFGAGILQGGPLGLFWGWNIVSIFMLLIALSQAEICSAFPTMGGLYFWVCKLCPETYVPIIGYVTGNMYALGMVFTGCAGNLSVALYINSINQLVNGPDAGFTSAQTMAIAFLVNIVSGILNTIGMRAIGNVSKFNVWFTFVGTIVLVAILFAVTPVRNSAAFAFFDFEDYTGWNDNGLVFMLGFLQAVYALEGSETSAQISEEAEKAEVNGPIAIYSSILGSWLVGVIYLIALNFNIQSVPNIAGTGYSLAITQLFYDAVGQNWAIVCIFVILVAQWAAALTAWTASARLYFALARDRAFPFKSFFMALTSSGKVPYGGVWFSVVIGCIIDIAFGVYTLAFFAILSCAAIAVLIGYAMPMLCRVIWPSMLNDENKGPFSLGKYSYAVNMIGSLFCVVMCVMFCLPTAMPVTATNMNYTVVAIGGVLLLIFISFFAWGKNHFKGPIRTVDVSAEDIAESDAKSSAA